ncbi:MAG: PKD domain-containing protein [Bacteroidota bacterium]|nr:PKD domain-containing protein [Bacteroidota bacterium]
MVKLLVTNKNGCYDSIVDTAVVNPLPDALFGWDLNCAGQPTYFTDLSDPAGAPIVSWWWNFGDTLTVRDTSSQQGPYYIYDSTGTYYPVLEVVNQNGCTGSFDTAIVVNPTPVAGFSFRENYDNVQGQLSFINESDSSALRYYWYFGEPGAESEEKDPVWQFDQDNYFTESYEIFLVSYNKYDCPDTAFYDYNFLFKGLFVPNAFAPTNPAAEVREFRPKGINLASYQVVVFDSWGNIILGERGADRRRAARRRMGWYLQWRRTAHGCVSVEDQGELFGWDRLGREINRGKRDAGRAGHGDGDFDTVAREAREAIKATEATEAIKATEATEAIKATEATKAKRATWET